MPEWPAVRASGNLFGVSGRRTGRCFAMSATDLLIDVHLRHGECRQRSTPPRLSCGYHRPVVFNQLRVEGNRVPWQEGNDERRAMDVHGAHAPRHDVIGDVEAPRISEVEERQGELSHGFKHERVRIHRLLGKVAAEGGVFSGEMTPAANGERREIDGVDRVDEQHWGAVRKQPFHFYASDSHGRAGIVGQDWILVEPAVQFCKRVRWRHSSFLPRCWARDLENAGCHSDDSGAQVARRSTGKPQKSLKGASRCCRG
jgi:hypothetical protein